MPTPTIKDLRGDILEQIMRLMDPDDRICFALASPDFLAVFRCSEPGKPANRLSDTPMTVAGVCASVSRAEWALASARPPVWLQEMDCVTFEAIASTGVLEVLKWARQKNPCAWVFGGTCRRAAEGGHLDVLKWARQNGCWWDEYVCPSVAAQGGHLDVLKWARANGGTWDEYTCSSAALGGHLGVLKWLHQNKCPWDAVTCSWAAAGGHLEVLQWARQNGCPWDERTCTKAALNGHLEVLKWARENGCPQ